MEEILTVLSNGGVYEYAIPTNFEDMDEFRKTIHYTKPEGERIIVEAIELVPKLVDLRSRLEELTAAVRKRIAAEDDENRRALADAIALHRMAAEPTLLRAAETANKIYYDASQQCLAIERENERTMARVRLAEYATAGVLGLVCILVGAITLRQVVRILDERERALRNVQSHRNGLNELVNERTAALEQMSRRHQLILRSAGEGIFGLDARGSVTFVNPAAAKMLGWDVEELLGKLHHDLIHHTRPDGTPHPQEECPIHATFQNGSIHRVAHDVFWRKDGTSVPVTYTSTPAWEGDELTGAVVTFQDITERKKDEEELRAAKERAEEALDELEIERAAAEKSAGKLAKALEEGALQRQNAEEANRLMNNILSSVGSIVIAVDENDRVTQWNAAAERIFEIRAEQAVGKMFSECDIAWESTETLEMIAACRESDIGVSLDEIRFTRPNGTVGLLSISVNPMQSEHNEYAGFVFLAADVTEQKVMEHELSRAQKLESVGALAAGIAHEINTPIQFVGDNTRFLSDSFKQLQQVLQAYHELKTALEAQGAAPALLEGLAQAEEDADVAYLKEEIPKAIDQTLEGVERVAKIVRAMKDFSHPDQGEKALADMNQALESTLTVARNELKYIADVVMDFDPSLPPVPCYLGDMNQVFLNVLVNAAHAIADVVGNGKSGKAMGKGTITVTTRREGNEAVIRIADTGTGIPEKVRDRIFDPFFTTKTVGKGTGQGLSLVHNVVVEKHGGALTFETELGKGTTFIIRLPIRNSLARTGANNEKKNPLRGR